MNEVFISYAWGGESEDIANALEKTFQERGIKLVRDKTFVKYKELIKEFMQQIGQGKYVVLIISDKYLKSQNCLFELLEIAKNGDFYDRIFPIVLGDANIYDARERLNYINYWDDKRKELNEKIKKLDEIVNIDSITEEMNLYADIRSKFDEITKSLKNMNTLTVEMHKEADFGSIIQAIELQLNNAESEQTEPIPHQTPNKIILANRITELEIFRSIINKERREKIFLIQGSQETGKTKLLLKFEEECNKQNAIAIKQCFKANRLGIPVLLKRMRYQTNLETISFEKYDKYSQEKNQVSDDYQDTDKMFLMYYFLQDLRNVKEKIVFLLDSWESCTYPSLFLNSFIVDLVETSNLFAVIFARELPSMGIWENKYQSTNLDNKPITNEEWVKYAKELGLPITESKIQQIVEQLRNQKPSTIDSALRSPRS